MSRTYSTQRRHRRKVGGKVEGLQEHDKRVGRRRRRERHERDLERAAVLRYLQNRYVPDMRGVRYREWDEWRLHRSLTNSQ